MEAIMFVAHPKDGTIEVPKKFWKSLDGEVQVIVLVAERKKAARRAPSDRKIRSLSIETKDIKIDREKLNVR